MSRSFNGGTAADRIVFSIGNGPPDQGPITMAVLLKSSSGAADQWILDADNGSFVKWGLLLSGGHTFIETDLGGGPAYPTSAWFWLVITKATGSVKPRWHLQNVTTSGAWSHSDGASNVGDVGATATEIILGGQFSGGAGSTLRGSVAVAAAWTSELNDGQVEAACTLSAADLLAASPGWMVRLNQASTATSVTDDTGGGGNQASISGTAVDADEPPGFDYSLTNDVDADGTRAVTDTITGAASVDHAVSGTATVTDAVTGAATVDPGGQGTATATTATTGAATVTHNAAGSLSVVVTATGAPEPAPTPAAHTGNWNSLLAVYRQNITDTRAYLDNPITVCPYHGEPLEAGRTLGTLHCKFGGEVFDLHGNYAFT